MCQPEPLKARLKNHHLADGGYRLFAIGGPDIHQFAPLIEQIAPSICGFDRIADRVGERHFDDMIGEVRTLGRPIPERRAEAVCVRSPRPMRSSRLWREW